MDKKDKDEKDRVCVSYINVVIQREGLSKHVSMAYSNWLSYPRRVESRASGLDCRHLIQPSLDDHDLDESLVFTVSCH